MEIQTRTLSIINPRRSLEYFLYDKLRVLQTRSTNIFNRFWELIRKVNIHFFFLLFILFLE